MKSYRATVQGNKWAHTTNVAGSSWSVAAARAVRSWQKSTAHTKDASSVTVKLVRQ